MKKGIAILVLGALVAAGLLLRAKLREAAEVAAPATGRELSEAEIREGLGSSDPKVRMDAFEQIDRLGAADRRRALLLALESAHAPTRLSALTALGPSARDAEVARAVTALAREDPDPDVREAAFRALVGTGDPRALEVAVEVLQSTEAGLAVRFRAARTLDRLTGRDTAGELAGLVEAAESAADTLSMDWDEWLSARRGALRWDEAAGRFVGEE